MRVGAGVTGRESCHRYPSGRDTCAKRTRASCISTGRGRKIIARNALADVSGINGKADVVEHPEVFDHVGLLVNGPPGRAKVPLI